MKKTRLIQHEGRAEKIGRRVSERYEPQQKSAGLSEGSQCHDQGAEKASKRNDPQSRAVPPCGLPSPAAHGSNWRHAVAGGIAVL